MAAGELESMALNERREPRFSGEVRIRKMLADRKRASTLEYSMDFQQERAAV